MTLGAERAEAARATLGPLLALPFRQRGRFRLISGASVAACLPASLDLRRITDAPQVRETIAAPAAARSGWALRMALAFRQDLWRRLRAVRGLAPAVVVRLDDGCATVTALACMLDGAPASPVALDALHKIFEDAALRRNRDWADRTLSRH